MKVTELIEKLNKILEKEGDLDVYVDSANELQFGDIKFVEGSYYSQRLSNDDPHAYIVTDLEKWD